MPEEQKKETADNTESKKKLNFKFLAPLSQILSVKKITNLLKYIFLFIVLVIIIILLIFFFTKSEDEKNSFEIFQKEKNNENAIKMPSGTDWFLADKEKGIILNTADNDEDHFLKYNISIFYEKENLSLPGILAMRRSQIKDEIRKIISSRTFSFLKSVENQEIIRMEIKQKIQSIVGYNVDGIINVFFTEFTLH